MRAQGFLAVLVTPLLGLGTGAGCTSIVGIADPWVDASGGTDPEDGGTTDATVSTSGDSGDCEGSAIRCSSTQAIQQICVAGVWVDNGSPCSGATPVCLSGTCVACTPGSTQCASSTQPQTCSVTGTWQGQTVCVNQTCLGGLGSDAGTASCQGVCLQGQTRCGSGTQPQTCTASGSWQDLAACTSDQRCVNGSCETLPSCAAGGSSSGAANGMTDCGSGESCCTSLEVTGGTYYRTYTNMDAGTDGATGEADPATVSTFRLDKYLVTVGRYRQFVAAYDAGTWTNAVTDGSGKHSHLNGGKGLANSGGAGTYETGWLSIDDGNVVPSSGNLACSSGYPNWTDTAGGQENLPINCVNWWEAYAFCIWDRGFLPSEAEWEYAAAGGSQQLEYPWGSTAPGTACPGSGCQLAIYNCDYPDGAGHCTGVSNVAPVGTATQGAGRWGQLDLAGEVWEWNADSYATYVDPCTDCATLTSGSERALRGGSFFDDGSHLLPSSRNHSASARLGTVGLRCARAP